MKPPEFLLSAGASSLEVVLRAVADHFRKLAYLLDGKVDFPAMDVTGARTKGNLRVGIGKGTFATADVDTYVSHDLGAPCLMWWPLSPSGHTSFRASTERLPTPEGNWIQSERAGVTAHFLFIR